MEKLEQFIRNKSELFNDEEPRKGHFDRFEALLEKEEGRIVPIGKRYTWMRVAAVAVVLVTAGLIGFDMLSGRAFSKSDNRFTSVTYTDDTREALDYYSKITAERMTELDRIAETCPEGQQLRAKALEKAAIFDANQDELAVALSENPGNEKMEAAVIRNQKLKEEALSNLILQGNMEDCNRK